MSKSKPIKVGRRVFPSRSEAARFFSAMLHRYKVGETVSNDDARHLKALFKLHPEFKQKTARQRIVGFDVNKATHGTNSFYAQLADGRRVHFSYKRCLGLKPGPDDPPNKPQVDLFQP